MGIKSPINIKILNDTHDIMTLMTHAYTAEPTLLCTKDETGICPCCSLIVDGGILQNAHITMIPGSTLIVRNNGKVNMALGTIFDAPKGVIVDIESGEISFSAY